MNTYIDTLPEPKVAEVIDKLRATKPDLILACGGDDRFALWMHLCNRRCRRYMGVDATNLEDWAWRDEYDAGLSPAHAVADFLSALEANS